MAVGIPLGPYRLVRRLATGGMAEIFLARQEGPDGFARELVVKRILPHLAADPEFTRMFRDEAKLAALLSHPNAVHVYDFGAVPDDDGVTLYLAMELVRGVDLRALILRALTEAKRTKRSGAIPAHHAAKIASFVCEALAHAHSVRIDGRPAGIVHRDVTPSNVLVSFDGAVKLADFGIAKAATTTSDRTEHGIVKGKHTYLSPEQARGESLDARSDLFNVGILIFESVLGEALFPPSDQRLARKLSASGQLPRRERFDRIPPPLAAVALKALSPDREDRYPDALALRSDLEAYLRACPEPSDTVEIGRFVRLMCSEELSEDALGPRAAGTIASKKQAATAPLTSELRGGGSVARHELLGRVSGARASRPSIRVPQGTVPIEPTGQPAAPPRAPISATQPLPPSDAGTTDPSGTSVALDTMEVSLDAPPAAFTHTGRAELHEHASALVPAPPTGHGVAGTRPIEAPAPPPAAATTPILRPRPRSRTPWIALAAAIVLAASVGAVLLVLAGGEDPTHGSLPRTASLQVSSTPPGARLFVDGVEHGLTPTLVSSITPGRAVRVELRGVAGEVLDTEELSLQAGERRAVELSAAPPTGLVRISTQPPGASVRIDGEDVGLAPLERELPLGEHALHVELTSFAPEDDVLRLERAGDRSTLSFALRPVAPATPTREPSTSPGPRGPSGRDPGPREGTGAASRHVAAPHGNGTLRITTTPWSEVYEGSRRLGITPLQVELGAGRHVLTLRAEDRPARNETVEIREGEVSRVRLVL